MMPVCIDLTEFLANPSRTGIQRVSGELCRWWAAGTPLLPVQLTGDRLVRLPAEVLNLIREYFDATGSRVNELKNRLAEASESAKSSGERLELQTDCRVLVPEVFYDPDRVEFFRRLPTEEFNLFYFIVYDLLPFTNPEFFISNVPHEIINGYTRVIRSARNVAFISRQTRDAYHRRLLRHEPSSPGPVLRLGSDGLGARGTKPSPLCPGPKFTVIGTIEPRKNHSLILEVFEPLLHEIEDLRLVFLGQMGWVDTALAERIRRLASDGCPGFEHNSSPSDDLIRKHAGESRATVYVSAAEGFGLPPVESLWLGTPVIASSGIPSLETSGLTGVHIVAPLNALNLREAVLAFLEHSYAKSKKEEALSLNLPTWASFSLQVAEWCMQRKPTKSADGRRVHEHR